MKLSPWKDKTWTDMTTKPLLDLRKEMNRLFDNFSMPAVWRRHEGMYSPSIEISEDEETYTVKAEIPGMDKNDVHATLHNNVLTIQGEKRQDREEKKKNTYYRETRYGAFHRSIPFETEVDTKQVKTKFANGVLTMTLTKKEGARTRPTDIEIK